MAGRKRTTTKAASAKRRPETHKQASTKPRFPGRISRPVHRPGVMNKTEAAFAAVLEQRKLAGEVQKYYFEAVTLKLSKGVRYTPDFLVIMADGAVRFYEIKGTTGKVNHEKPYYHNAGGRVKVEVAAALYPFVFVLTFKARGGNGWIERELD